MKIHPSSKIRNLTCCIGELPEVHLSTCTLVMIGIHWPSSIMLTSIVGQIQSKGQTVLLYEEFREYAEHQSRGPSKRID